MKNDIAKIDRLALAWVRENKERSRALPAHAYRDPASTVEFPAEIERQKALAKQKRLRENEMLRRVRKEDVKLDAWIKPDALDYCLECWQASMHKNDTDLGIQGQRSLKGDGDGYGNDDTAEQRRVNDIATATHAMIHSLRQLERWAIYRKCGISTVWNFPSADFFATVESAMGNLSKKLRENIATRTLF